MNRARIVRCLACFILILAVLIGLLGSPIALAADEGGTSSAPTPNTEEPQTEEADQPVQLVCKYPIIEGVAGETFNFELYLAPTVKEYAGKYDFNVVAPPEWVATLWLSHPDRRIKGIDLEGVLAPTETITVKAAPVPGKTPEPGEYVFTFEMMSDEFQASIDLTAVVTDRYELDLTTATGRLNTEIKGEAEQNITILLENTGTAPIEDIALSSDKPDGWGITFEPDKIDSLEPNLTREVNVSIKPPQRTIAHDYNVTLKADSKRSSDSMNMRITVQTPRIWSGGGIGIAVSVIAGLVFLFRRLSMR